MQTTIGQTYKDIFAAGGIGRPIAPEYTNFAKSWGWYKIIADLANNEVLNFERVTSMAVAEAFNFLRYRRDQNNAEKAQRELDLKIAKAQRA